MTDPLAFLEAAHARAEQATQALTDDLWWADQADRIEVYNDADVLIAGADDTVRGLLAAHDPAAVLRRIAAERRLLADLQAEPHQVKACEDTWYYCAAADPNGVRNSTRECDCGRDQRVGQYVQALAETWGWQEGEQQ